MKLSLNWLNTYFKSAPDWDCVLYKLTQSGIEVEDIEDINGDKVVEFKITPNRGDALSVLGILREITVLTEYEAIKPASAVDFKSSCNDQMQIEVKAAKSCPNYMTLVIKNINNKALLPEWIIDRLNASGSRSVSPVVDITNYVMLELGQPLHAFDRNRVGDKLQVRFAASGEKMQLLTGVEATFTDNTLLICDSQNKPAAIAGVMGGTDSGVVESTTYIVLESAFFVPEVIAGQAKHYGVSSDSAYRFERGVDPQLQDMAIKYAASLIVKYCGGVTGQVTASITPYQSRQIKVSYSAINRLIGVNIDSATINRILTKLGFAVNPLENEILSVTVPSHRFDVTIKEDVIEEIARVYGYDNIEAQIPVTRYTMGNIAVNQQQELKTRLVNLGYSEIIGYAFIEERLEELLGNPAYPAVRLQNPIANLNVMRTSLIADLVKILEHNLNYGHKRLRIFELARVFYGEGKEQQPLKLAGLVYGNYMPAGWFANRPVDFYDVRNDIEMLLSGSNKIRFSVCNNNPIFHSGRCAKISFADKEIGVLGQLHPRYKTEFGFSDLPYLFELDMDFITDQQRVMLVHEVSKFQKVERDLAFLVELKVHVGDILDVITNAKIPYLVSANVFDVYHGDKLGDVKLNSNVVKSVAINFLFQGDKTLSEGEINLSLECIQQCIQANFTAQLRI